jgi:two-component system sensor histidine kinase/response regulator
VLAYTGKARAVSVRSTGNPRSGETTALSAPHDIPAEATNAPKAPYGFEALAADNLRPGSVGAALTFCFLLLGQLASYPRQLPFPWAGVVLAGIALLVAARAAYSKSRLESATGGSHVAEAGIALAALIHSLTVIIANRSIDQTTHVLLLVIAAGCVMLYPQWLVVVLGAAALGWTAVLYFVLSTVPEWPHFAYAFALAALLSVVIFITRVRTVERLEAARRGEHDRRSDLESAMRKATSSEARFRQLLVATSEGILVHRNGEILEVSDNAARMLRVAPNALIGKRIDDFLERSQLYPATDQEPSRHTRLREGLARGADGREFPIEFDSRPIEIDGRSAEVVTFRDATAHKQMLDAITDQRAWERAILNSALDCIISIDPTGHIVEWNRAAERTFGWRRDEVVGASLRDLIVPPVYRDAFDAELAAYNAYKTSRVLDQELEGTALRRDATEIPVEFGITATDGTSSSVITAYLRDVTDRQETELELSKARDQAIRASTVKSEFLATMSHEIRTPMNGVLGMTALLLGSELSAVQRRHAMAIEHSAKTLLAIINDILDFSKIEAGRVDLEHTTFDLHRLLAETTELLGEKAHSKSIELSCQIDDDVPSAVVGDPLRVRQVVTNLVDNAVKYTAKGEVSLHVMLACDSGDDKLVLLCEVRDTGPGLSPEAQAKLFTPFVQGDASMTRRHGGTGLGLAICRRLVELMGGEIGVESRAGEGSTFWFTVTLEKGVNRATSAQESLAGRRVLLASDHDKSASIVAGYVRSWSMSCEVVTTPADALASLDGAAGDDTPWDIVLIDHSIAGNSGIDFARTIRSDARHLRLPIVLLTALSGLCTSEVSDGGLVTDIVTKPVSKAHLFDCLLQIVAVSTRRDRDSSVRPLPSDAAPTDVAGPSASDAGAAFRILVAEDNPINQEVAALMLDHLGYETRVANNGVEALAALDAGEFDLVLMDCQMPEMDGFTASAKIRARADRHASIPVIAMTANAMKGDREKCLDAGMNDYIAKPIDPKELAAKIAKWCPTRAARSNEPVPGVVAETPAAGAVPDTGKDTASVALERHLAETGRTLLALRAAISYHDEEEMRRLCDTIHGRAEEIGAWRVSKIVRELAGLAVGDCYPTFVELERAFDDLRRDLFERPSAGA